MVPCYKIMISPLCDEDIVNLFDGIATSLRLYSKAKVFLDLRDGPLRFLSLNTAYTLVVNEFTGDLSDETSAAAAAVLISPMIDVKQIDRVLVDGQSLQVKENLYCSGIFFESTDSFLLDKEFSLNTLTQADCCTLEQFTLADRRSLEIKLPNLKPCLIELKADGSIEIDGEEVSLENFEKHIKLLEIAHLQAELDKRETDNMSHLADFYGATILDDLYCYLNPDANMEQYKEYKLRLIEWFFQLKYSELLNYSGNNTAVGQLLASINDDLIILPYDYFEKRPLEEKK